MEHENQHRLKYISNTKSRGLPKNMNNCTKLVLVLPFLLLFLLLVVLFFSTPTPIVSTHTPINNHKPSSMQTTIRNSIGKNILNTLLRFYISWSLISYAF